MARQLVRLNGANRGASQEADPTAGHTLPHTPLHPPALSLAAPRIVAKPPFSQYFSFTISERFVN